MDDAAREGERASTSRRASRRRDENETRGTRASEAVDRTERCFAGSEVRTRASSVGGRARRVGATANRERVGRRRASRLEEVAREATYLQPGEVVDPRVRRVFVDELGEIGLAFPHPVILARMRVQRGKAGAKADTDPCVAARGERGVINCSPRYFHSLYRAKDCLSFVSCLIVRRPLHCIKPSASSSRERQSMTDLTLSISAALRDAQLQRLEASLAAKTPAKPQVKAPSSNDKGSSARG